jgi:hypothetical protein
MITGSEPIAENPCKSGLLEGYDVHLAQTSDHLSVSWAAGVPIYFLDQAFTQREAAIGSPTNFDGDRLYRRRKADCVSET